MNDDGTPTVDDFFIAVRLGEADALADIVASGVDVNAKNSNGETALMVAAQAGDEASVKALLGLKADTAIKDIAGNTVIQRAIRKAEAPMLRLLVDGKADIETRDNRGMSPLEAAILMMIGTPLKGREMFDILMDGGADAKAVEDGVTTVMWAAMADSAYALHRLVEKGANVHAVGLMNQTALTVTAENNAIEVAKALLEMDVDTTVRHQDGLTAYEKARKQKNDALAEMILRHEHALTMRAMSERAGDTEAPAAATFRKRGPQP